MTSPMMWLPVVIILGLATLGAWTDPTALAHSWLAVTLTWGLLPLGALAWLMIHGLTGGRWGDDSRWIWRALASTLPLFVVSLLPLLFALESLFSWVAPAETLPEVVRRKLLYLNEPFFVVRALAFALLWLGLAWLQGVWGSADSARAGEKGCALGLILWLLVLSFFGFDWFMALEPQFYSDVFGLMLATNALGAAMAAGLLLGAKGSAVSVRRDLSGLWVSALLGWVFLVFSQYIIIWSGNMPNEIGWYLHRSAGLWRPVSVLSFALFAVVPFCLLLSPRVRQSQAALRFTAGVCLAGHVLRLAWLVLPAFTLRDTTLWLTPLLLLAVGLAYWGWLRQWLRRNQAGPARFSGEVDSARP